MVLACLIAIMNKVKRDMEKKGKDTSKFGQPASCCTIDEKGE